LRSASVVSRSKQKRSDPPGSWPEAKKKNIIDVDKGEFNKLIGQERERERERKRERERERETPQTLQALYIPLYRHKICCIADFGSTARCLLNF
jgi:hypothetical protein